MGFEKLHIPYDIHKTHTWDYNLTFFNNFQLSYCPRLVTEMFLFNIMRMNERLWLKLRVSNVIDNLLLWSITQHFKSNFHQSYCP